MGTHNETGLSFSRRRLLIGMGIAAGGAVLAACGAATPATETPRPLATAMTMTMTGSTPSRTAAPVSLTASPAMTASSAVAAPNGSIPTLAIEAFDYGYRTMGSIPGGVTLLQMKNTGNEPHHTQVMRLNPGVDLAQFAAAAMKGPEGIFPVVSFVGGPGAVGPGDTSQAILDLTEGQYVLACFVQGMDMVPHLAKGMVLPLTATASTRAAAMPAVNGTITMYDFNFEMPATLPAGKGMYRVVNQGAQVHEFDLFQLLPGKTPDDLKTFFDPQGMPPMGPPPAISLGGMQGLTKGLSGILPLDLKPGNYAALCMIPDQSKPNGESHLHLGMIKAFTVA